MPAPKATHDAAINALDVFCTIILYLFLFDFVFQKYYGKITIYIHYCTEPLLEQFVSHKKEDNKSKWLLAGYELFGEIGPEALNVEKLSNIVGLNRSSFYHYFGDIEIFESRLLEYHISRYENFYEIIKDYEKFELLFSDEVMQHKTELAFQRQLMINEAITRYKECSTKARQHTEEKTYELWTKFSKVDKDSDEEWKLFKAIRDFYFVRYGVKDEKPEDVLVLLHRYLSKANSNN